MPQAVNLIGQRFGKLTVIERIGSKCGKSYWRCVCDCGGTRDAVAGDMKFGRVLSCGCLKNENHYRTHGMSSTKIYRSWNDMMTRCYNTKDKHYKWYGTRGITVCDKWLKFEGFYEDMGSSYEEGLTLDRIDVNGNYCKENCKWSTIIEQCNNRRSNHIVTYNSVTDTLTNICKLNNVSRAMVTGRLKLGYDIKTAIEKPPQLRKR
jgi:hypothetical protein